MSRLVLTGSGRIRHNELGVIHYVVRSRAKRFVARWKTGELQLSVPPRVTEDEFYKTLDVLKPRLLPHKPADSKYYLGQVIDCGEFKVIIESLETNSKLIEARRCTGGWALYVPASLDISSPAAVIAIGRVLRNIAAAEAPAILIPRANELADRVGRHPIGWTISKGQRTLGRCDCRGYIALSCILVFYEQPLRDYVIYHELAHLSEMNHSPRFHKLCNHYCQGREQELVARLKASRLPV